MQIKKKNQTKNLQQVQDVCVGAGRAFLPPRPVLNLFSSSKFTNPVAVSRCQKPELQILSTRGGYVSRLQRDS